MLALFFLTITACKSPPKVEPMLPPEPQRKTLSSPSSIREYAEIIAYYDELVCEWELWAETAKEIISTQNQ